MAGAPQCASPATKIRSCAMSLGWIRMRRDGASTEEEGHCGKGEGGRETGGEWVKSCWWVGVGVRVSGCFVEDPSGNPGDEGGDEGGNGRDLYGDGRAL